MALPCSHQEMDLDRLQEIRGDEPPGEGKNYDRDDDKSKRSDVNSEFNAVEPEEIFEFNAVGLEEIFEPAPECCIYMVPGDLRKINEEAYTPQLVSIGPLAHLSYNSVMGNATKMRYVKKFVERTSRDTLKDFWSHIKNEEGRIRACYAESIEYMWLVDVILYDVVFIFELFLRNDQAKSGSSGLEFDILLDTPCRKAAVKRDLQLLENQIPYFVFKELFIKLGDSVRPSGEKRYSDPFLILALRFFYDSERSHSTYSIQDLKHFTDLRRCFLLKEFSQPNGTPNKHIRDLRCATRLHDSGVKFKKSVNEDRSSLQVSCEYIKRPLKMIPCIKWQELELQIPRFDVYDETECLIRNVMAFEQLHYPWETHVCNYILLMDSLIDTEKDVDLLVDEGIIFNLLGDNAAIANMFNRLGLQVTPSYSCYYDIGEKLKAHYDKSWNHSKATLKHVYFSDPWIGTGTVAAALLLLLTLVQTVCSILQVL